MIASATAHWLTSDELGCPLDIGPKLTAGQSKSIELFSNEGIGRFQIDRWWVNPTISVYRKTCSGKVLFPDKDTQNKLATLQGIFVGTLNLLKLV